MSEAFIIDRNGRKRRYRPGDVLGDGERFSIPMTMQDEQRLRAAGLTPPALDGVSVVRDMQGFEPGHRRGYQFADTNHLRDAADEAYRERNQRLQDAWRRKGQQRDDDHESVGTPTSTHDEARAAADRAYRARNVRLSNAWRRT